jgi:spore germination cell wall hydrolase CwlJ-like protein
MTNMNEASRRAARAVVVGAVLIAAMAAGAATGKHDLYMDRIRASQMKAAQPVVTAAAEALQAPMAEDAIAAQPSAMEIAMVKIEAERRCLAEAMYYEARGEGVEGEEAIAEVVFHRMRSRGYPASICGVVYQGDGAGCQFSFVCDGEMRRPKSTIAWMQTNLFATRILNGYVALGDATGGATSFHAVDVEPDWSESLERTVQIGNHVFYRPLGRTRAS